MGGKYRPIGKEGKVALISAVPTYRISVLPAFMETLHTPHPTLSVIVMAWNEAKNLCMVVQELTNELQGLDKSYEILIIDDGSSDGTSEEADRLASESSSIRVVHHACNQGLGGVYRTGFKEAHGDWLTFFPADGQFPAAILGRYAIYMDNVDLVLGYLDSQERPLIGRFLSLSERIVLRLLFGHFPRFQGILLFRRELLYRQILVSQGRGWTILMEFILRAIRQGARYQCVPIPLRPRRSGKSKVTNLRSIASNLRQLIALRLHL